MTGWDHEHRWILFLLISIGWGAHDGQSTFIMASYWLVSLENGQGGGTGGSSRWQSLLESGPLRIQKKHELWLAISAWNAANTLKTRLSLQLSGPCNKHVWIEHQACHQACLVNTSVAGINSFVSLVLQCICKDCREWYELYNGRLTFWCPL